MWVIAQGPGKEQRKERNEKRKRKKGSEKRKRKKKINKRKKKHPYITVFFLPRSKENFHSGVQPFTHFSFLPTVEKKNSFKADAHAGEGQP